MIFCSTFNLFTAGTSAADSDPIPMGGFAGGVFRIPSTSNNTTLTFFHSDTEDGTFQQLYDDAGAALSITLNASTAADVPLLDALNEVSFLKVVAGTTEFEIEFLGKTL